jgi:hypothetical protein
MDCQDRLAVCVNGQELVSIEPLLEEQGGSVGGTVVCRDIAGAIGIALQSASPQAGGPTVLIRHGGLDIVNTQGQYRVRIVDGDEWSGEDGGTITLNASTDSTSPMPDGSPPPSAIVLNATERLVQVAAEDGTQVIRMSAAGPNPLEIRDPAGRRILTFDSAHAALYVGAKGNEGDLVVVDGGGTERIHLNAQRAQIFLRNNSGGDRIVLDGAAGEVAIRGLDNQDRIQLMGALGEIVVKGADEQDLFDFSSVDATLKIGGDGQAGQVVMFDATGRDTLTVDGARGDIVLENADCAEEFDVADDEVEPGTVLVIDEGSVLRASRHPYDSRAAGVVAGAGGRPPGIVLGHRREGPRVRVALAGRTYCKVDARPAPIALGSLLTTSSTRGHAMNAVDRANAFGAVLGKALAPLESGLGLIPILVALQ